MKKMNYFDAVTSWGNGQIGTAINEKSGASCSDPLHFLGEARPILYERAPTDR